MKRYSIAGLKAVYARTPPTDTPALLELKRWRAYADTPISASHVARGLELVALVSELTITYRHNHWLNLDPADQKRLADVLVPPQPVPAGEGVAQDA